MHALKVKGEADVEGGISHQSTAKESLALAPALPQTCMERPYYATTDEVMAYYQVWKGGKEGGSEGEEREGGGVKGVGGEQREVDACPLDI